MKKLIQVIVIGTLPNRLNLKKIKKWKSEIFEIKSEINEFSLNEDSDEYGWSFSDDLILRQIPKNILDDFVLVVVNLPLTDNWYSRRIADNVIVFSYYQIKDILEEANIPLENIILRLLYTYTLLHYGRGIIKKALTDTNFTHDETKGCIYDMNGLIYDVVESCHAPIICDVCIMRMHKEKVPKGVIARARKEIKRIRREWVYTASDFIRLHPYLSIIITTLYGISLGIIGSILGALLYSR